MKAQLAALLLAPVLAGCEGTLPANFPVVTDPNGPIFGQGAPLTEDLVAAGLKEALALGSERSADVLGVLGGYGGNEALRITLPGRLGELHDAVRGFGPLAQPFDELEDSLNRAAEAAAPEVAQIVGNAVRSLTIQDAFAILNGGDDAATTLLRDRTEGGLRDLAEPFMRTALERSGAYAALDDVAGRQGLGGLADALANDVTDHAVSAGLDGFFAVLSAEERRIREEPVARTTELLRRVFGSGL